MAAAAGPRGLRCGFQACCGWPRLLDIDILLYGDDTIDSPELQIPHPRMRVRKFVLAPLAEIAPHLKHPNWPADAAELLGTSADQSQVKRIEAC